ncbi:MspA family porin [Nocardia sp. NPDC004068]|uniref:MspA family porin n=1 Tax=Nocardia sp. NPDC004068 TaxID=3364303 RepID=UPI003681198F
MRDIRSEMYGKSAMIAALTIGVAAAPAAAAEKTYSVPGLDYTVGNADQTAHAIPAVNGMPTNREVLADGTFYGRASAPATGKLHAGYFVACAAEVDATLALKVGLSGYSELSGNLYVSPSSVSPGLYWDVVDGTLSGSAEIDASLKPGKITDVKVADKDLRDDTTGTLYSRDFRIEVDNCVGPLTLRPYTSITADTPETSGTGMILGDSIQIG